MELTFSDSPSTDEEWSDLGLRDDDLQELQSAILASRERYPIVPGTGGLRKIRFVRSREARGKSGAYRVGYVRFREFGFHPAGDGLGEERQVGSLSQRSECRRRDHP